MEPVIARQFYEKASEISRGDPPKPFEVKNITIPGPESELPAIYYRPSDASDLPILVFFHGGGYVIGSPTTHDAVCRHLCVLARCIVISVDYRLAPEHKFPAAPQDAYAATCWVVENAASLGGDPANVAVGGDSAGGNLSAGVCLAAKNAGGPNLVYQLLIYPGTDMTESFPSHKSFGQNYLLTASLIGWFHKNYMDPESDLTNWQASPLHASDHSGLPPAFVLTAGFDPLQDEGKAYAEKLKVAGVDVTYSHYEGMLHGFITQPGLLDKAIDAINECAELLRSAFKGKG
jgi:acetyl esterase